MCLVIHFRVVSHAQNLFVPGRCFIRDGVVTKICRKGPKKRYFFLFDDILVCVHTAHGSALQECTVLHIYVMELKYVPCPISVS